MAASLDLYVRLAEVVIAYEDAATTAAYTLACGFTCADLAWWRHTASSALYCGLDPLEVTDPLDTGTVPALTQLALRHYLPDDLDPRPLHTHLHTATTVQRITERRSTERKGDARTCRVLVPAILDLPPPRDETLCLQLPFQRMDHGTYTYTWSFQPENVAWYTPEAAAPHLSTYALHGMTHDVAQLVRAHRAAPHTHKEVIQQALARAVKRATSKTAIQRGCTPEIRAHAFACLDRRYVKEILASAGSPSMCNIALARADATPVEMAQGLRAALETQQGSVLLRYIGRPLTEEDILALKLPSSRLLELLHSVPWAVIRDLAAAPPPTVRAALFACKDLAPLREVFHDHAKRLPQGDCPVGHTVRGTVSAFWAAAEHLQRTRAAAKALRAHLARYDERVQRCILYHYLADAPAKAGPLAWVAELLDLDPLLGPLLAAWGLADWEGDLKPETPAVAAASPA